MKVIQKFFNFTALLVLGVIWPHSSLEAAVIATEDFSYSTGNIDSSNGGTGWNGAWTVNSDLGSGNAFTVTTPGSALTYSNGTVSSTGSGNALLVTGDSSTAVDLSRSISGVTGKDIYFSYLVQAPALTLAYNDYLSLGTNNAGGSPYSAVTMGRFGSGTNDLGAAYNSVSTTTGATEISGQAMAVATTYMFVGKFSWNAGSSVYDTVTLWVNPDDNTSESETLGTVTSPTLDFTVSNFSIFSSSNLDSDDQFIFDNFVVGEAWSDVVVSAVPEPSTYFMLILGGGGLLLFVMSRKRFTF